MVCHIDCSGIDITSRRPFAWNEEAQVRFATVRPSVILTEPVRCFDHLQEGNGVSSDPLLVKSYTYGPRLQECSRTFRCQKIKGVLVWRHFGVFLRSFNTMFTRTRPRFLSWARWIYYTPCHSYLRSILILFPHKYLWQISLCEYVVWRLFDSRGI